jgi:DNA-binding SARP family transcriptional activator
MTLECRATREPAASQPPLTRTDGPAPVPPERHGAAASAPVAGASEPARLLRLYGPLTLEPGERLGLRYRAARGLVAYLALHHGRAGADELSAALWPDEDPLRARPRLHKASSQARSVLGGLLAQRAGRYSLNLAALRVDLDEVERAARAGASREQLEAAVALSAGEPLADLDHPFACAQRRRLLALRYELRARLCATLLSAGDPAGALAVAEELLAADRLNERGWRLAFEAEAALGSRQAIVERYRELGAALDQALGLRPQAETRATFLRLLGPA